jgi:hypothetical protein
MSALRDEEVEATWSSWRGLLRSEHVFHRWCERLWQTQRTHRDVRIDPTESRLPAELGGDFLRYLECRIEEALEDNSLLAMQWWFDIQERRPNIEPEQRLQRDFALEFERYPHFRELVARLGVFGIYEAADLNPRERAFCDLHYLMGLSQSRTAFYLGIRPDAIWMLASRVRDKFAELLSPRGVRWAQAVVRRYAAPT